MDRFALQERTTRSCLSSWSHRLLLEGCRPFSTDLVVSNQLEKLAIILANVAMLGPDEPDGICNHRVQHRLEFSGRRCDDPKNFAGCRLLVQGLCEVAITNLQFLKQPHILNRDDRLVGEGLQKSNLFVCEGPNLRATDRDGSDGNILTHKRDGQDRPKAQTLDSAPSIRVLLLSLG